MIEALQLKYKPYTSNALLIVHKTIVQWKRNRQTRRALHKLNDWQLDDIGIDRQAANAEAGKMFWQ